MTAEIKQARFDKFIVLKVEYREPYIPHFFKVLLNNN